jgi:hypothetical protein
VDAADSEAPGAERDFGASAGPTGQSGPRLCDYFLRLRYSFVTCGV